MTQVWVSTARSTRWLAERLVQVGVVLLVMQTMGCGTIAPTKDPVALRNAVNLKAESLALIEKATDPPALHRDDIQQLRRKLQAALEHEKQRADRNPISVKQWELLLDPKGNLLGGFLTKWETEGKGRTPAFLAGVKQLVAEAFDQIIEMHRR